MITILSNNGKYVSPLSKSSFKYQRALSVLFLVVLVLGSNNAMNVAKAVMNALTSLQDVRVVAKKRGKTPKTLFEI